MKLTNSHLQTCHRILTGRTGGQLTKGGDSTRRHTVPPVPSPLAAIKKVKHSSGGQSMTLTEISTLDPGNATRISGFSFEDRVIEVRT
jgi:hypothetical protein